MSIIDLEVPFKLIIAISGILNTYSIFLVLVFRTWPVVFLIIPTIYITIFLQVLHYEKHSCLVLQ